MLLLSAEDQTKISMLLQDIETLGKSIHRDMHQAICLRDHLFTYTSVFITEYQSCFFIHYQIMNRNAIFSGTCYIDFKTLFFKSETQQATAFPP